MTSARPCNCTEYRSLFPTDSTKQDIAIPRLASSGEKSETAGPRDVRKGASMKNEATRVFPMRDGRLAWRGARGLFAEETIQ